MGISTFDLLARLGPDRILRFDTRAVFRAMDDIRVERGLSWTQVAEEIGGMNSGRPIASFTVGSSL